VSVSITDFPQRLMPVKALKRAGWSGTFDACAAGMA